MKAKNSKPSKLQIVATKLDQTGTIKESLATQITFAWKAQRVAPVHGSNLPYSDEYECEVCNQIVYPGVQSQCLKAPWCMEFIFEIVSNGFNVGFYQTVSGLLDIRRFFECVLREELFKMYDSRMASLYNSKQNFYDKGETMHQMPDGQRINVHVYHMKCAVDKGRSIVKKPEIVV